MQHDLIYVVGSARRYFEYGISARSPLDLNISHIRRRDFPSIPVQFIKSFYFIRALLKVSP